ncbi:MAG: hypothetical protein C4519_20155 [Desulfobacteraceae bacterium]|nr:MAG: hypothetical protein C4519_20155 [Desulfobacteraceae bacterium]
MDIFRGLKFSPNTEIGENSHFWMDTNYQDLLHMIYFRSLLPAPCFGVLIGIIIFLGYAIHATVAWAVDISDLPLDLQINAPGPMIMLVWDDSGSMDGEFMTTEPEGFFDHKKYLFPDDAYSPLPDHVDGLHRALNASQRLLWRSQWAGCNRLYYDPHRTYQPWPATEKYAFGPADPHRPWSDPTRSAAGDPRFLLSAAFFITSSGAETIVIPNAHYFILSHANGNGEQDGGESVYLVTWQDVDGDQRLDLGTTPADDRRRYFRFNDDGDGRVQKDELHPVFEESEKNTLKPVIFDHRTRTTHFRSDREELQNFANWFTYHRRRGHRGKALTAQLITGLRQAYVGIWAVNRAPRMGVQPVRVIERAFSDGGDQDTASGYAVRTVDRSERLLDALYASASGGKTPLRTALDQVGRYFDHGSKSSLGASPFKPAGQGGGCQSAHAVVISDGFWNDLFSGVGNADGDQGKPHADAWNETLADVAMYYYKKDLAADLDDQVSTHSCDNAVHQHMRTHALSLAANGTIDLREYDKSGFRPDFCVAFSGPASPEWPQPRAGQPSMTDDLLHAVVNGRGIFSFGGDAQNLIEALKYASGPNNGSVSQAGPVVNGLQIDDRSVFYQALYNPGEWTGDVLAFAYNPNSVEMDMRAENALWRAADHLMPSDGAYDERLIVTYGGPWREPQGVPFRYSDLSDDQKRALGSDLLEGSPSDLNATELLDYIRGREFPHYRSRSSLLGDIVHSAPVLAGETLFVGANDGMLHAFDAQTGQERFAYVPNLIFHQLKTLSRPDYSGHHRYFVDATPYAGEVLEGQYLRKYYLLGGLGKGGKGYYCLHLQSRQRGEADKGWGAYETLFSLDDRQTDTTEQDISQMVMWEYPRPASDFMDNDGDGFVDEADETDPDMGYSFGQGYVVNANAPRDSYRPVAIFSNGYNSSSGKAVLYILDVVTGELIRKIDTGAGDGNGLSPPALIDVNLDRCVDYVYAGDLKGNLWKFDLTSGQPHRWGVAYGEDNNENGVIDARQGDKPQPLFQAGEHQPITGRPDAMSMAGACWPKAPGYMVIFGTGKYLGELDRHDTQRQSIYGIWDFGDDSDDSEYLGYFSNRGQGLLSSGWKLARRQIVDQFTRDGVVYRQLSGWQSEYKTVPDSEDGDENDVNNNNPKQEDNPAEFAGWFLDFAVPPDPTALPGERVTGKVVIRNGQAVIVAFAPIDQPCESGGVSWVYALHACGDSGLPKSRLEVPLLARRYEGRMGDHITTVKNAATPMKDFFLGGDLSGNVILQEITGEIWGKVFWQQHLNE